MIATNDFLHPKRLRMLLKKRMIIESALKYRLCPLPKSNSEHDLVVVLTSFGDRLKTVHIAIRSIMNQTLKPNRVVLYLDEQSEDSAVSKELSILCSCGLEIRTGYKNYRAHVKYLYAFEEFADSIIVTIDDDVVYPKKCLARLVEMHRRFPRCVIARRAHKVQFDETGSIKPYSEWSWEWQEKNPVPRNSLVATGVGAVLYPPGIGAKLDVDRELLRRYSLNNDDLWLKALEIRSGIPVVLTRESPPYSLEIDGTQQVSLNSENVWNSGNDIIMRKLMDVFCMTEESFQDGIRR